MSFNPSGWILCLNENQVRLRTVGTAYDLFILSVIIIYSHHHLSGYDLRKRVESDTFSSSSDLQEIQVMHLSASSYRNTLNI